MICNPFRPHETFQPEYLATNFCLPQPGISDPKHTHSVRQAQLMFFYSVQHFKMPISKVLRVFQGVVCWISAMGCIACYFRVFPSNFTSTCLCCSKSHFLSVGFLRFNSSALLLLVGPGGSGIGGRGSGGVGSHDHTFCGVVC